LPCGVGFAHESPSASRIFLLPDLTCVEIVARPKNDADESSALSEKRP
jgi:hypothetical protein